MILQAVIVKFILSNLKLLGAENLSIFREHERYDNQNTISYFDKVIYSNMLAGFHIIKMYKTK